MTRDRSRYSAFARDRGSTAWRGVEIRLERRIRAVRLFQDRSGWTPHYTGSGVDASYLPICFGPEFVAPLSEA